MVKIFKLLREFSSETPEETALKLNLPLDDILEIEKISEEEFKERFSNKYLQLYSDAYGVKVSEIRLMLDRGFVQTMAIKMLEFIVEKSSKS